MHQKKPPPVLQDPGSLTSHIIKRTQNLMPRDRLRKMRIRQPMLPDHIRRITRHHIKRSRPKNPGSLPDITLNDPNPVLKTIIPHTTVSHLRTLMLDLQPREMLPIRTIRKQDRNDPRTGPHIQSNLTPLHPGKARQQNRIHPKAKLLRILDHKQPILKIIHTLTAINQITSHSASNLPF